MSPITFISLLAFRFHDYKNINSITVYDMNSLNMVVESEVLKEKSQSFLCLGPYSGEMTSPCIVDT